MAWIDDRIWCHPKFTELSSTAFSSYVRALAYSSGMGTSGHLTASQQRLIGADAKTRRELLEASLWDTNGDGDSIVIHDWDEHNGDRDARRERERERKRRAREEGRWKT